ncbi:VanZ family protein [Sphingobacterium chuzhouense]|uniref:VanZ family protein n=1 Tax=Sphingobacterium chuzhouense TaxID=1742264 RepID=A0ABR7XP45_9SPHI|nr:VanZ family protein [Sphingobacterium chuzhouense]
MRNLFNYIWAIVWGIMMLLLMGMPSDDMPGVGFFEGFDKMAHCGFFFVFTALLLLGSISPASGNPSKIKTIIVTFLIASIFAFGTEAIQYYLSTGRQADWWDIFADYVGIGMALFSYILFYRRRVY